MKKLLLLLSIVNIAFVHLYAQTGIVKGRITEAVSGKPIEFATVQLEGTSYGAQTDSAGQFSITELKPGIYNVRINCLTYKSKGLPEIEVTNGKPAILSVELETDATDLKEVVVQANPFTKKEESPISVRTIG
ncbi:MAG TPA: carboxypeptidase-like regulatory domain-containing protein, partial [Chitinophagales bacterium]|nr:carboxypeptidase-like regulatory domain-containing protein [Chitinophagales bacterium]